MKKSEILIQLNELFKEVLDNESIVLNGKTSMDTLDDWDSLTHVQLILSIEKKFNICFTSVEIQECRNVSLLIKVIASKH